MAAFQSETLGDAKLELLLLTQRMRGTIFDVLGPVTVEFDLDRPHVVAILWLSLGPSNVSDIAKAVGQRQNRATVIVDRLSERGLVERVRREDDRRFVTVRLTNSGCSVVLALTESVHGQLDDLLLPLSSSELDQLNDLLRRLAPFGE